MSSLVHMLNQNVFVVLNLVYDGADFLILDALQTSGHQVPQFIVQP